MTEPLNEKKENVGLSDSNAGLCAMTHFFCDVCQAIKPTFFHDVFHEVGEVCPEVGVGVEVVKVGESGRIEARGKGERQRQRQCRASRRAGM